MKLQTIHEATYAGDHPIVTEIKQALKTNQPVDVVINDQVRGQEAVQGIVKSFGEPSNEHEEELIGMSKMMVWNFPDNRLQVIIQGDRTIVELFQLGKRKTKLLQRMRRRQTR